MAEYSLAKPGPQELGSGAPRIFRQSAIFEGFARQEIGAFRAKFFAAERTLPAVAVAAAGAAILFLQLHPAMPALHRATPNPCKSI